MKSETNLSNRLKVLVVEDDAELQQAIKESLEYESIEVIIASSSEKALEALSKNTVHMVISDINMPGMCGETLLMEIRKHYPFLPVMLMTAYSSVDRAVKAIQRGAVDYLAKPFSPKTLANKVRQYSNQMAKSFSADQPVIVDQSSKNIFDMALKVSDSNANVLITGESGTGKEVLARFIHNNSSRKNKNFIAINCAAIPENMLEAILFGHEKGSFTGAHKAMPGKFEMADGGTLLLDEVTEMPLGLQAKILRVLQEKEVERIGSKTPMSIDVRVISTSNRDLNQEISLKNFREDLFYRLNVFPLHWQPLRNRKDDIYPLAQHLLSRHVSSKTMHPLFSQDAIEKLLNHTWPGNVRELDNVIQRALVLCNNDIIYADDLLLNNEKLLSHEKLSNNERAKESNDMNEYLVEEKLLEESELTHINSEEIIDDQMNINSNFELNKKSELKDTMKTLFSGEPLGEDLRTHEFNIILSTLEKNSGNRKRTADDLQISPRTLRYKIAQMKTLGLINL